MAVYSPVVAAEDELLELLEEELKLLLEELLEEEILLEELLDDKLKLLLLEELLDEEDRLLLDEEFRLLELLDETGFDPQTLPVTVGVSIAPPLLNPCMPNSTVCPGLITAFQLRLVAV